MLSPLCGQILGAAGFLGLPRPSLSEPTSFSFEDLKTLAQTMAHRAYRAPQITEGEVLEQIDYDEYQKIRYRPERALHLDSEARFSVELFHLGKYARVPVRISIVDGGQAREVVYKSDLFDIPPGHAAKKLSENVGFAGFRIMDGALKSDWFSAIGASYFRSSGPFNQYGLSARGIAVNTASSAPEEFPKFVHLWLEPAPGRDAPMTIYALLDGPSIAGAYKVEVQRAPNKSGLQNTLMTVETALYLRSDVERIGIAPFSSMFWYGKAVVRQPRDWRPEYCRLQQRTVSIADELSIPKRRTRLRAERTPSERRKPRRVRAKTIGPICIVLKRRKECTQVFVRPRLRLAWWKS